MKPFYLSTYYFQDGVKIFLLRLIIFKEHNGSVSLLFLGGTCNILTSIIAKLLSARPFGDLYTGTHYSVAI